MADEFERMVPGKKLRPSARLWNELADVARERRALRMSQGEIDLTFDDVLSIRNAGADQLPQFAVVSLGDTIESEDENRRTAFDSAAPVTGEPFAIVQVPLEAEIVGKAKIFGVSRAYVNLTDITHEYADAVDGDYERLLSQAGAGRARILDLDYIVPPDTALDGGIADVVAELVVATSEGWPDVPFVATIDAEDLLVTKVVGETWTVTRGHGATDAAAHADAAAVVLKSGVVLATVLLDPNNHHAGITSINGDTTAAQNIGIGSGGTDVNLTATLDAWSGSVAYQVGWIVSAAGAEYICILAHTGQAPPNATYWRVVTDEGNLSVNIPSASTTARGVITTETQVITGIKYIDGLAVEFGVRSSMFSDKTILGMGWIDLVNSTYPQMNSRTNHFTRWGQGRFGTAIGTGGTNIAMMLGFDGTESLLAQNVPLATLALGNALGNIGEYNWVVYRYGIQDKYDNSILRVGVWQTSGGLTISGGIVTGGTFSVSSSDVADNAVNNTKLADMPAWTIKARNAGSSGDPQDVALADLAAETTPSSGDYFFMLLADGSFAKLDVANLPGGGSGTDNDAIHDNVAGEIVSITEKTTLHNDDLLIIEDTEASYAKKKVRISNLPAGTDDAAIHDNVSGEIAAITEKTTPHNDDLLIIEDSEASNAKKRLKISNLPGGGSGDVVGPSLSTDNAIARFDGTTGKLLQDSALTLSDTGAITFPDDVRQSFNPGATNAGLNVGGQTSDPSSPSSGDIWYRSDLGEYRVRIGLTTHTLSTGGGGGSDSDAIHDNVAAEFSAITNKAAPIDGDVLLIEDSADGYNKKYVTKGQFLSGAIDVTAIHDNVSGEFPPITGKIAPVANDVLIIEDSEASYAKRSVTKEQLLNGVNDASAIHDNQSSEFPNITGKYALAENDLFIIEDSEASYAKRSVLRSDIVTSGSITNAKQANMAAWTLKARNNSASGAPQDVASGDLTEPTVTANDYVVGFLSTGELRKFSTSKMLSPLTAKGDLFTFDTDKQRLPVGADGKVLHASSSQPTGLFWQTVQPTYPVREIPTGAVNGVNTVFTISATAAVILVFRNGMLQAPLGVDVTISSTTITFAVAPITGDVITTMRFQGSAPTIEAPTGSIDGANVDFIVSATPIVLMLFRNGMLQAPIGVDYTLTGAAIAMAVAPITNDTLTAVFW